MSRRFTSLFSLIVLAAPVSTALAQPAFDEGSADSFGQLALKHLGAPFSASGATLLGLGLGTALLSEDLENPEYEVRFLEWPPLESVSDVGNAFGAGHFVLGASISTWMTGAIAGNERWTLFGRDLTASFVATGAWVWVLKVAAAEPRPNGAPYSFPSGHTAVAFASATTVQRHFGIWPGAIAYTLATMTAAARMEDSRHYFRDVAFGAALGMTVGGIRLPLRRWFRGVGVGPQGLSYSTGF